MTLRDARSLWVVSVRMSIRGPRTTYLIVSEDPSRRRDWARVFADGGRVLQCPGPAFSCSLSSGRGCPLIRLAEVAIYDRDVVTPGFAQLLERAEPGVPVFELEDETGSDGSHRPVGPVRRLLPLAVDG